MSKRNERLHCYVTGDEQSNYLGIFVFEEQPKCGDLVEHVESKKYYVVITEDEDISVDEFSVEEITRIEFEKFSKEWGCQILTAKNIYNSSQELCN